MGSNPFETLITWFCNVFRRASGDRRVVNAAVRGEHHGDSCLKRAVASTSDFTEVARNDVGEWANLDLEQTERFTSL